MLSTILLPQDPESYVHRIGRTGRAGKQGTAITFVTSTEYRRLTYIKKTSKSEMKKGKLPEIKDVIKAKRTRVKAELESTIKAEEYGDCLEMSEKLLEEFPAEKILAALLKYAFKEKFDESMYARDFRQFICRQNRQNQAVHCYGKSRRHDSGQVVRVHAGGNRRQRTENKGCRDFPPLFLRNRTLCPG